jgi:hypothetical protein
MVEALAAAYFVHSKKYPRVNNRNLEEIMTQEKAVSRQNKLLYEMYMCKYKCTVIMILGLYFDTIQTDIKKEYLHTYITKQKPPTVFKVLDPNNKL